LRDGGVPSPVERVMVTTPTARIGAITEAERSTVRQRSPVGGKYDTAVNRESAAEILAKRASEKAADPQVLAKPAPGGAAGKEGPDWTDSVRDALLGTSRRQGMIEAMAKSASRAVGSRLGQQIVRGVLGGIFGGKR
jgi:hypothetical protein